MEQLMQLADVSHPTQSWEVLLKWNGLLFREVHAAYMRREGQRR